MIEFILARYNYWIVIALMMIGLYIVFAREHLIKKMIGLNIFQTSVFILYITISNVQGGTVPILAIYGPKPEEPFTFSNPLPHVLILTAIVVGVATLAVGLALAVRIKEAYGTLEESLIQEKDKLAEFGGVDPDAERGRNQG